jgi:phosphatidylglycerophosphatase A
MDRPREWAATCFYLGEFPFCPGTAGSLGAVALYMLAALKLEGRGLSIFAGVVGLIFAGIGIRIGRWGQEWFRKRDPREFVLDEAAGMMISLVAVTPLAWSKETWKFALAAFLFFRAFDIFKPFPVGRSERLRGGWGIVMDDIIAGVYAAIATHLWFHYV